MHRECMDFISRCRTREPISIIEVGSRDVNGTPRGLFPNADYTGLDVRPGPCVDVVIDAERYTPDRLVDMVICTEVFEHAQNWPEILAACVTWVKPGGSVLITCAGPGRHPHSAVDGEHRLLDGEYYENIAADELRTQAEACGLIVVHCEALGEDVQMLANAPISQPIAL